LWGGKAEEEKEETGKEGAMETWREDRMKGKGGLMKRKEQIDP